jgi:hypothetical protein
LINSFFFNVLYDTYMKNCYIKMRNIISRSSILFVYEQIVVKYYDYNYYIPEYNLTMASNICNRTILLPTIKKIVATPWSVRNHGFIMLVKSKDPLHFLWFSFLPLSKFFNISRCIKEILTHILSHFCIYILKTI